MKPEFEQLLVPIELGNGENGNTIINRRNVNAHAIFGGLNAFFSAPVLRHLNDDLHIAISRPAPQSAIEQFNARYGCLPSITNLNAVGRKHFILPLDVFDDHDNQLSIVLFKTDSGEWEGYVVIYHFDSLVVSQYFSELKKKEKWGHNASTTAEYRNIRHGEFAIGAKEQRLADYILYQYEVIPVLIWTVLKGISVERVISATDDDDNGGSRN